MKKDLREKDDAVSPVIALMLILAILATCMAVYTTTYVPGLKQQDEITHTGEVKLAFERFAADIDNTIALGKPAVYTEVLELGGGDVPLSPTKSSGTIEIEETILGTYSINSNPENLTGVKITYLPSFTAWEKQGYVYKNGIVWIVKDDKKTPSALMLYSIQDGEEREEEILKEKWYSPEVITEDTKHILLIPQFTMGENIALTGTSVAKLRLNATITEDTLSSASLVLLKSVTAEEYSSYEGITHIRWLNIEVSVE